jgi:uncharacterized protein (DUF3084 family)
MSRKKEENQEPIDIEARTQELEARVKELEPLEALIREKAEDNDRYAEELKSRSDAIAAKEIEIKKRIDALEKAESEISEKLQLIAEMRKEEPSGKVRALKICTVNHKSFWRAGRQFGDKEIIIPISDLSLLERQLIKNERNLKVQEIVI